MSISTFVKQFGIGNISWNRISTQYLKAYIEYYSQNYKNCDTQNKALRAKVIKTIKSPQQDCMVSNRNVKIVHCMNKCQDHLTTIKKGLWKQQRTPKEIRNKRKGNF